MSINPRIGRTWPYAAIGVSVAIYAFYPSIGLTKPAALTLLSVLVVANLAALYVLLERRRRGGRALAKPGRMSKPTLIIFGLSLTLVLALLLGMCAEYAYRKMAHPTPAVATSRTSAMGSKVAGSVMPESRRWAALTADATGPLRVTVRLYEPRPPSALTAIITVSTDRERGRVSCAVFDIVDQRKRRPRRSVSEAAETGYRYYPAFSVGARCG